VIVRISNEEQYRVDDGLHGRLNELDDAAVAAVAAGDEDAFHEAFEELLQVVRSEGTVLGDDDLDASDVILPPADLSFVEAGEEFTGDGLIPEPAESAG
jgi:acylphosphatase